MDYEKRHTRRAGALLIGLLLGAGCRNESPPSPVQHSAAPAVASSPTAMPSAEPSAPVLTLPARTCRALAVNGQIVEDEERTITARAPLDGNAWLQLEAGASLSIKHVETGREIRVEGPARVLPCFRGEEQFLLARGTLTTSWGVGARPGAEVLIATPSGVVGYGDARLRVTAGETVLQVDVRQGTAWIEGIEREPAPETIASGKWARREVKELKVKELLTRCETAAARSEERARDVLDRTADKQSLGKRAAEHLRARHSARKACGIAAAALGLLPPPKNHAALIGKLNRAEALWQRIPPAQIPPKG